MSRHPVPRYRLHYELLNARRVLLETDDYVQLRAVADPLHPFARVEPRFLLMVDDRQTGQTTILRAD